jgi:hypothetical protein
MDFILIDSDIIFKKLIQDIFIKLKFTLLQLQLKYNIISLVSFSALRGGMELLFFLFFFNAKKKCSIVNVVFTIKRFNYKFKKFICVFKKLN